jgi:hypothetical protein
MLIAVPFEHAVGSVWLVREANFNHVPYTSDGTFEGKRLIRKLDGLCTQVWYADDSGTIEQLHAWWDKLGPAFGYFPNPTKTWIITKEDHHEKAITLFSDSGINITQDGRPYLGAAIGRTSLSL